MTPKNAGLIERAPLVTDWQVSGETGIAPIINQADGNWLPFLPTNEKQQFAYETNACVTFSFTNWLEIVLEQMRESGKLSPAILQACRDLGYFDANDKFNFSDRFLAVMDGTNPAVGNYLTAPWEAVRKYGLVGEADWSYSLAQGQAQPTQDAFYADYYKAIPGEIKDKALKFLELFDVNYEWVLSSGKIIPTQNDVLRSALRLSPLHIATIVCDGWNTPPVAACDASEAGHATCIVNIDQYLEDYDHYNPFVKQLALDYPVMYAVRGTVTPKVMTPVPPAFHHTFAQTLQFGDRGVEVAALQTALIQMGFLAKGLATGYFGELTLAAVKQFQQKYAKDILTPIGLLYPTGKVATMTNKKLNSFFAQ